MLLETLLDAYFAKDELGDLFLKHLEGLGNAEKKAAGTPPSMRPERAGEVIHQMLTQPAGCVMDEVTVHPLGQDF